MILGIIIGILLCLGVLYYLHKTGKLESVCKRVKALLALLKFLKPKQQ